MSTVEQVESQAFHQTTEGTTMLRVFNTTYTDFLIGKGGVWPNSFPYFVGDSLLESVGWGDPAFAAIAGAPLTYSLRISDIQTRAIDNINIRVEVFYSNVLPTVIEKRKPDTSASWEESFSMNSSVTSTDDIYYTGQTSAQATILRGSFASGKTSWLDDDWLKAGNDEDDDPGNETYTSNIVWNLTLYSSTMRYERMTNYYLSVNTETTWAHDYFTTLAKNNGFWSGSTPTTHLSDFGIPARTDLGRWLITDINIRRERFDSWRYDIVMSFNPRWRWNYPYGVGTQKYAELSFAGLLVGMDNDPPTGGTSGTGIGR